MTFDAPFKGAFSTLEDKCVHQYSLEARLKPFHLLLALSVVFFSCSKTEKKKKRSKKETVKSVQRTGPKMTDLIRGYEMEDIHRLVINKNIKGDAITAKAGTIIRKAYGVTYSTVWTGFGCFSGVLDQDINLDRAMVKAYVHELGADYSRDQIVLNAKEIVVGQSDIDW